MALHSTFFRALRIQRAIPGLRASVPLGAQREKHLRTGTRVETNLAPSGNPQNHGPFRILPAKSPRPLPNQRLWRLAFFALLSATVYLSWKPAPGINEIPWMPSLLGRWFDHYDGWKNFIGFCWLAFVLLMAWREPSGKAGPTRAAGRGIRELRLFAGFCCLVALLEIGQLALPKRTCDWRDVLVGWLGGLIAWAILYVCRGVRALFPEL